MRQFKHLLLNISMLLIYFMLNVSTTQTTYGSESSSYITSVVKDLTHGKQVSLIVLYPEGSLPNISAVSKKFTSATKVGVSFQQVTVDDINTKMLLSAAQNIADFDVALPATFGIPNLADSGAILDISIFARKHEAKIDYAPSLYSLGDSYNGNKYGYQTDGDTYVMFYKKSLLESDREQRNFKDQFGYHLKIPKTWKELDDQMKFFHRPKNDMFGGCMFRIPRYMVWEWWIRFHAKGGFPMDDNAKPQIASEQGISALNDLIEASKYQHSSVRTNGLFENWREYAKGNCYANIGWGGTQKFLNSDASKIKGDIVHAPTPEVAYFNWGWNYVVAKQSKHPEIAYLFTLFATLPENSLLAIRENGFFDPFRIEHYEDPEIIATYTPSFLSAHKTTMQNAIPDFYIPGQGLYIQALQEAIVSVYEGFLTAEESLQYAAKQWEEITIKLGRENQVSHWKSLKQKYPY